MSQDTNEPQAKKIIVDEDWKSQVQAEREAVRSAPTDEPAGEKSRPAHAHGPLPTPTLSLLATSLGMQAMIAMGIMPNPIDNKLAADLDQARHLIDTIDLLWRKTEGNRTAEESTALDDLLHDLRMAYVAVQTQPKAESGKPKA